MSFFTPRSPDLTFTVRDQIAFACFQSLLQSGRTFTGYPIIAVEAYELADAFIDQRGFQRKK